MRLQNVIVMTWGVVLGLALMVIWIGRMSPAFAQELDLSASPPVEQIIAAPGSLVQTPITLTNHTENALKVHFSFKPFWAIGEDGSVVLDNESGPLGEVTWFRIEKNGLPLQDEFELRPNEMAKLTLLIDVPKETSLSDHYTTVLFRASNEVRKKPSPASEDSFEGKGKGAQHQDGEDQTTSIVQAGIGEIILLSIDTTASPPFSAALKEFIAQRLFLGEPIGFRLLVANEGRHFLNAKGEITIKDIQNQTISALPIPSQIIVAGATRNLASDTKIISSRNLFGKYTAEALVDIGSGQRLTQEFTFYVLPKNGMITIGITLLLIVLISRKFQRFAKWKQAPIQLRHSSKSRRH